MMKSRLILAAGLASLAPVVNAAQGGSAVQTVASSGSQKQMQPHSHMQEKTGIAPAPSKAAPGPKATRSSHEHGKFHKQQ